MNVVIVVFVVSTEEGGVEGMDYAQKTEERSLGAVERLSEEVDSIASAVTRLAVKLEGVTRRTEVASDPMLIVEPPTELRAILARLAEVRERVLLLVDTVDL